MRSLMPRMRADGDMTFLDNPEADAPPTDKVILSPSDPQTVGPNDPLGPPGGGGLPGEEPPPRKPPVPEPDPADDDLPLPPAPPLPPSASVNSPLAIPGTFTQPGTPGAASFRTPNFYRNRVVGQPSIFGPGTDLVGGGSDISGVGDSAALPADRPPEDDELVRRIISGLAGGRR